MGDRSRSLGIFLAGLCLYMAFCWLIPITDPVESNYALTAKEMLQSGDWLSPRIYGEVWFDKPALIYWMLLLSYQLFGVTDFAARLPSTLFSAFSLVLVDWFVRQLGYGRKAGWHAALFLASMLEFWFLAHMVITDAALFFFHNLALCSFFLAISEQRRDMALLGWVACGFGVLTKGPVGLLLPGLIMCVYLFFDRKAIHKSRLIFTPLPILAFFLVAAPWYGWMTAVYGDRFLNTFLGLHNYVRATVSEHSQDNVWYYYLLLYPLSMLPWTGLLLTALRSVGQIQRTHKIFLLTVIGVTIGFYNLMATKYPTYIFPVLFFTAVLLAIYWNNNFRLGRCISPIWSCAPLLLLIVGAGFAAAQLQLVAGTFFYAWLAVAFAMMGSLLVVKKFASWQIEVNAAAMLIFMLATLYFVLTPIAQSRSAKAVIALLPEQAKVVSVSDYSTSAVYYSGKSIIQLVDDPNDHGGAWAGKYTMPRQTIAQYLATVSNQDEVYILVKTGRVTAVTQDGRFKDQADLTHEAGGYRLYRWQFQK